MVKAIYLGVPPCPRRVLVRKRETGELAWFLSTNNFVQHNGKPDKLAGTWDIIPHEYNDEDFELELESGDAGIWEDFEDENG